MQVEIPILRQILLDDGPTRQQVRVWMGALEHLDLLAWRELKISVLELQLGVDAPSLSRALAELCAGGWLYRRRRGRSWEYRVPLSCGTAITLEALGDQDRAGEEPTPPQLSLAIDDAPRDARPAKGCDFGNSSADAKPTPRARPSRGRVLHRGVL